MALSLNNPIRMEDINTVHVLKDSIVYRLTGYNDEKLVIKHEGTASERIKAANMVIRTIDTRAKTKILTPQEERVLVDWADDLLGRVAALEAEGVMFAGNLEVEAARNLKAGAGLGNAISGQPWVKMEHHNLLDLERAFNARLEGDKSGLTTFRKTLKRAGGLEKLGEVVAADLFNGYTDRFDPTRARTLTIGQRTIRFQTIINLGNIFVSVDELNTREVRANDFVNNHMLDADPHRVLNLNDDRDLVWRGTWLGDKEKLHNYARGIISDLEIILSPNRKNMARSVLGFDAESRLYRGMKSGARKIRERLIRKYPGIPSPGLRQRLDILNVVA